MAAQRSTPTASPQTGADTSDVAPFDTLDTPNDLRFFPLSADFGAAGDFAETALLAAPELDDLTDTDNLVAVRLERRTDIGRFDAAAEAVTEVLPRVGQHRMPRNNAAKSRLLVAAMALGGAAAATYSVIDASGASGHSAKTVLASDTTTMATGNVTNSARGVQLVTVTPAVNSTIHSEEFARGAAYAQERAEREARLQRPLFVKPTNGIFTSGYGYRWGALHAGIDLAAPIGTPIYAVADGVVTDAGPTAGYGAWVKIRHADGTVTLYGHVNSWLVSVGQRVMAGDEIATVGNRGQSTGPHCHFSVLLHGTDFIDPQPWLAQRGITLGAYAG